MQAAGESKKSLIHSNQTFIKIRKKVTKPNPNYFTLKFYTELDSVSQSFFLNFVNPFKRSEIMKLIIAPITAKIIVFRISSETIFGMTLNKVPDAVPICKVLFDSISR